MPKLLGGRSSMPPLCMEGLEPLPMPLSVSISRKLELGVGMDRNHRHFDMGCRHILSNKLRAYPSTTFKMFIFISMYCIMKARVTLVCYFTLQILRVASAEPLLNQECSLGLLSRTQVLGHVHFPPRHHHMQLQESEK